jgi:ssDNA-binding replication factor A large subunit
VDELIRKLSEKGLSEAELKQRVSEKQGEFGGLLTEEGALKLVAREHGISVEEVVPVEYRKLVELQEGERANVFVRVTQVFAPKAFEKEERRGRVCNLLVRDESAEGTLVLWNRDVDLIEKGAIERNDLVSVKNALVKKLAPLELHSGILTEIKVEQNQEKEKTIPRKEEQVLTLSQLRDGEMDFDLYARVLDLREEKGFVRERRSDGSLLPVKKDGLIASCWVSDGSAQARLVLWDKNAELVRCMRIGDAVKVEGGYVKKNVRSGALEIHAGWRGRVVLNPRSHSLAGKESMLENTYAKAKILDLKENEAAIIDASLLNIYFARVVRKCLKCGAPVKFVGETGGAEGRTAGAPSCECGSTEIRETPMIACELSDDSAAIRCVFYGRQALELLGVKEFGADPETILQLKKEYLVGKKLSLVVTPKTNPFSGELELVARHLLETK